MSGSQRRAALGGLLTLALAAGVGAAPQLPQLEDPPVPFEAKTPRTEREQRRIDAVRDFVAARALEEGRRNAEAFDLLEKALASDPGSPEILRTLSRLAFALSRNEQAIAYSKKAVEADPTDSRTLRLLVAYYTNRVEPAGAEAVLKQALDSPKLAKDSAAYLVIQHDLGILYAGVMGQVDKAADAFAVVLEGLDEKAANGFTPGDTRLILGESPEATYEIFGDTLFQARRYDLAIRAYRRGLAYNPDDIELPVHLAEALLRSGQKAEALATLEPQIKLKPESREPYELLAQVLIALDRKAEVLPKLEGLLEADPKNVGLKYVLADRYKEQGQVDKANALYEGLMKGQEDGGFGALALSLRQEKKYEDLLKLLERTLGVQNGRDAVILQLESLSLDKEAAGGLIDTGVRLLTAEPPGLGRNGQFILLFVASRAELPDKLVPLARLAVKQAPNPRSYRDLCDILSKANQYNEAADALQELFAKFPEEAGDSQLWQTLSVFRYLAGNYDQALEAAQKALKINPLDARTANQVALNLGKLGRFDEAIAQYKELLGRPGDNEETIQIARQGLSAVYVEMGELDKGEAELEILFARTPDDAGVNNDLGYLYADRGKNLEKAEAMVRKALDDEPDNGAYLDSLGWVLYRRDKVKDAIEPLERAAKIQPWDATVFDHLGDVHFRLQDHAKARECWEKAEALMSKTKPPDRRVGDVRRKLEALKQLSATPPARNNP